MNEKVIEFLNKKDQIIKADRDNFLIELGLIQKVYSPENLETYEYSKYEYNNGEKRYYKEIALVVTDIEYSEIVKRVKMIEEIEKRELCKIKDTKNYNLAQTLTPLFELPKRENFYNDDSNSNDGNSELATTFKVLAWIIWILGFFFGAFAAFNFVELVFVIWSSTFLLGILLYAIAQILEYLALITAFLQYGYKITRKNK